MNVMVSYKTKFDGDDDGWGKCGSDFYTKNFCHARLLYAYVKISLGPDMTRAASNIMKDQILDTFASQLSGHRFFKKITKNQLGFHDYNGSITVVINIANLDYYSDQHFSKKTKLRLGQLSKILVNAGQVCSDLISATLFASCF